MLKYGIYAKAVELLCFKSALERLSGIYPEMDMKAYKKKVKCEYKAMLQRTPDIGGSSLEMNLYIAAFASWAKEKTALHSFRVYVIWMKEIIGTKAENCIGRKHWHREMSAAIFM